MDEIRPLLGHVSEQGHVDEPQSFVPNQALVDFDPNGDPDNPLDWSRAYKLQVVFLLVFMAFTV